MKNLFNKKSGLAQSQPKGFTLIELLVVIGILAILLSIVLIAINPARQFAQANNTKRRSDTTAILNAISQYAADHKGALPPSLAAVANDTTAAISDTNGALTAHADLCTDVVTTIQYIPALPSDPKAANNGAQITVCSGYATGYTVAHDANNRVTVTAPLTEVPETTPITVTR